VVSQTITYIKFAFEFSLSNFYHLPVVSFYPLSIFFLFPRLISAAGAQVGCLPYFDTWCGPSANLECRSKGCCTRLAANAGPKKSPKTAIWAPSYNFVGLYLRNYTV